MKKIVVLLLSAVMLLSFGITAYGAEVTTGSGSTNSDTAVFESNSVLSPNAWYYSYEKTVVKYYLFLEEIPESISYSEYNSGMGVTCSGTLNLQDVLVRSDGSYKVTFKGTIGAYIY